MISLNVASAPRNAIVACVLLCCSAAFCAAPSLDLNGAQAGTGNSTAWIEDAGVVSLVTPDATVVDSDSNINSITITIQNALDGVSEVMAVNTGGTVLTFVYGGGVLLISGSAPASDYQTVLRTLTYDNTNQRPTGPGRTITAIANDGTSNSATETITLTVTATNDAPTVAITAPVDGTTFPPNPGTISITTNAADVDGTVAKVEFFDNDVKIGESATSSFNWNATPGVHNFTAIATDDLGAVSATSARVNVVVGITVLVPRGSTWKYLDNGSNQGTAWYGTGFDDSAWLSGKAQLGYGDGDEVTTVGFGGVATNKYVTTYFRLAFNVADASLYGGVLARVLHDDGVIVYLNGAEIFRRGMATGTITYNTLANLTIGGNDETVNFYSSQLVASNLITGTNVLAVEIHQAAIDSSDISMDLELGGAANKPATVQITTPADNGSVPYSETIHFDINAADADGTVKKVELFEGTTSLGIDTTGPAPFTIEAEGLNAGVHTIYAVATDDFGSTSTSAPVTVRVGITNLLPANSTWKYNDSGTDLGTTWLPNTFDDSAWLSGPGILGYGDSVQTLLSYGPSTTNKYTTYYFRNTFNVADVAPFEAVVFRLVRDDGAVVYFNGTQVFSVHMPALFTYTTFANATVNAPDEQTYFRDTVPTTTLTNGLNHVQVEVHQINLTSTDIDFDLEVNATGKFPPSVRIKGPTVQAAFVTSAASVDISGIAWDNVAVTEVSWSTDRGASGIAVGTTNWVAAGVPVVNGDTNITITAKDGQNTTATATLKVTSSTQPKFRLTVTAGTGTGDYFAAAVVPITATVPANMVFDKWTGATANITDPNVANTTVTMPAQDITVTATFKDQPYNLTVVNGTGSGLHQPGSPVTITANTIGGQVFAAWTGPGAAFVASTTSATTTLTMPAQNISITATYSSQPFTLTVVNGTGGGLYAAGSIVTITADAPPVNLYFDQWTGATVDAQTASTTMVMPALDTMVTANFRDPKLVVVNGSGGGNYPAGFVATIQADAAPTGQQFDSWTGATVTDPNSETTTITMPAADTTTVTANYVDSLYTLTVVSGIGDGQYKYNEVATITADAPPLGKVFDKWTGATFADANSATTTMFMPPADTSVTATYKDDPNATYILIVISGTGSGLYKAGVVVTVTADSPPQGKIFDQWTVTTQPVIGGVNVANPNATTTTISMPAARTTVTATFKDAAANIPPTVDSAATAVPNPAIVNQAVTLNVTGTDANGDTLTYAWDFGDSTTGSGASTTHTYTATGNYTAIVTITDGRGGTVSSSVTFTVFASSTPMTVTALGLAVKFTAQGADSMSVAGSIPNLPQGYNPLGVIVGINVGGATSSFTLDAKGKAKNTKGSITLKMKFAKGTGFIGGPVPFTVKVTKSVLQGNWTDEGIVPSKTTKNEPMTFAVQLQLGANNYIANVQGFYTGTAGKSGKFKR